MSAQLIEAPIEAPADTGRAMTTTPDRLLEIALSRGADMAQLEKLLELKERFEAGEARKAFTRAMAAFKAEPMEITKNRLVEFRTRDGDLTSYRHAELSDITEVVAPAMAKHGLRHSWNVQQDAIVTVTCTIMHEDGHSESVTMHAQPDTSGKKNPIQQVASTVTYLQRYTLLAATGMATKGADDDGQGAGLPKGEQYISEEQEAQLRDELEAAGADQKAFLKFMGVEKLSQIYVSELDEAKKAIEAKRKGGK